MLFKISLNLLFFVVFNPMVATAAALCKNRGGGRSSETGIRASATFELDFGIKIMKKKKR